MKYEMFDKAAFRAIDGASAKEFLWLMDKYPKECRQYISALCSVDHRYKPENAEAPKRS
jgi:hypothetical protein